MEEKKLRKGEIIGTPGKFEGEPRWAPSFWSMLLEGGADWDEEAEVMFTYDYGDRCRTRVCEIVTKVEERAVRWSDYHGQNALDEEMDDVEPDEDEPPTIAVVLTGRTGVKPR